MAGAELGGRRFHCLSLAASLVFARPQAQRKIPLGQSLGNPCAWLVLRVVSCRQLFATTAPTETTMEAQLAFGAT